MCACALCLAAVFFPLALRISQVLKREPSPWLWGSLGCGDKRGKGTCQTFGRVIWGTFVSWIPARCFQHTAISLPVFLCKINTCQHSVLFQSSQTGASNCRLKLGTVLLCSVCYRKLLECVAEHSTVQSSLCSVFFCPPLGILPAPGLVAFPL